MLPKKLLGSITRTTSGIYFLEMKVPENESPLVLRDLLVYWAEGFDAIITWSCSVVRMQEKLSLPYSLPSEQRKRDIEYFILRMKGLPGILECECVPPYLVSPQTKSRLQTKTLSSERCAELTAALTESP